MTQSPPPGKLPAKLPERNLLAGQSSPYLIQHAGNPVHWRPWGEQALAEAQALDKPILLSVGYAACHWCHVMAHESFENESIATLMNALFVNIKVDREERPDIDQIYMAALHAMGEQGGWPLTMFLAPDGRPFWGGTYFPPENRYGRPGFPQVLQAIEKAYRQDRDNVERNAMALHQHLAKLSDAPGKGGAPDPSLFDDFATRLLALFDMKHGGIRGAPKFPNAPMTEIWLRAAMRKPKAEFGTAFLHTLERMSQGGIYDHLGGGLARYSTDDIWLVPHFEKMLYDNAHYIRLLTRAFQLDSDEERKELFRVRIEETIDWLRREMRHTEGGFYSSLDADSEGEEGRFYVWTRAGIDAALGDDAAFFCRVYGVTEEGNFHAASFKGANILNRLASESISKEDEARLSRCRKKLLALRDKRIRPGLDDKILADWNGYMIRALAEAGFAFDRPDWINLAMETFQFITGTMSEENALSHSWRDGVSVRPALATDYAAMMNAALSLYLATGEESHLRQVRDWLTVLDADYADGEGGYYLTSAKAGDLIIRPRADTDEANPSGASQILEALARLSQISGETSHLERAHALAANLHSAIAGNAYGQAGFFGGLDTLIRGRHAKLFVENDGKAGAWIDVIRRSADPALTWQIVLPGTDRTDSHLGMEIIPPANRPAAIVCSGNACSAPLETPETLSEHLAGR